MKRDLSALDIRCTAVPSVVPPLGSYFPSKMWIEGTTNWCKTKKNVALIDNKAGVQRDCVVNCSDTSGNDASFFLRLMRGAGIKEPHVAKRQKLFPPLRFFFDPVQGTKGNSFMFTGGGTCGKA